MNESTAAEWRDVYEDYGGPLDVLANELEDTLVSDSALEADVLEVFARRLSQPIDGETMDWVRTGLDDLGLDRADALVTWSSRRGGSLIAEFESDGLAPHLSRLLRRLLAAFGPELDRAVALRGAPPNDWRKIRREVHLDLENDRFAIHLEIEKFNGESLVIDGDQNSVLAFARNLLDVLQIINAPDAFIADELEDFLSAAESLTARLRLGLHGVAKGDDSEQQPT